MSIIQNLKTEHSIDERTPIQSNIFSNDGQRKAKEAFMERQRVKEHAELIHEKHRKAKVRLLASFTTKPCQYNLLLS